MAAPTIGANRTGREFDFDPSHDRLFGVGDLVERGPHSAEALEWIERRFEAVVLGNHERPLLYWLDPHRRPSSMQRPQWLCSVPRAQHSRWRAAIAGMPLAITIETAHGPVGVVHADVPDLDWNVSIAMLETGAPHVVDTTLLGVDGPEDEVYRHRTRPVEGLRSLVHGHFVVGAVEQVANRWNIDTGGPSPSILVALATGPPIPRLRSGPLCGSLPFRFARREAAHADRSAPSSCRGGRPHRLAVVEPHSCERGWAGVDELAALAPDLRGHAEACAELHCSRGFPPGSPPGDLGHD